jgi:hypothetical protein
MSHLTQKQRLLEIWKPTEFPFYEASNLGRIRSVDRYVPHPIKGQKFSKGKILKLNDYGFYSLVSIGKDKKTKMVHRIIAKTFIPNLENKPCVNHKNGIKTDNRIENLEWVTYSENEKHSYKKLGKKPNLNRLGIKGFMCSWSKPVALIDDNDIILKVFATGTEVEKNLIGVNRKLVSLVCLGKRRQHAGYKFKFISRKEYATFAK